MMRDKIMCACYAEKGFSLTNTICFVRVLTAFTNVLHVFTVNSYQQECVPRLGNLELMIVKSNLTF